MVQRKRWTVTGGCDEHGMAVQARIDDASAAAKVGMELWLTEVLVSESDGRHATDAANQTIGVDLPLRALVWQDGQGKTWLGLQ